MPARPYPRNGHACAVPCSADRAACRAMPLPGRAVPRHALPTVPRVRPCRAVHCAGPGRAGPGRAPCKGAVPGRAAQRCAGLGFVRPSRVLQGRAGRGGSARCRAGPCWSALRACARTPVLHPCICGPVFELQTVGCARGVRVCVPPVSSVSSLSPPSSASSQIYLPLLADEQPPSVVACLRALGPQIPPGDELQSPPPAASPQHRPLPLFSDEPHQPLACAQILLRSPPLPLPRPHSPALSRSGASVASRPLCMPPPEPLCSIGAQIVGV